MNDSGETAGVERLQRQWEMEERIRGGWLLDSKRLRKAALVEYRCKRDGDLIAALVKVEGTLFFMWRQYRSIAVVNGDELQDWDAGEVPEGVDADAVARAEESVNKWRDVPGVPSPNYRPESLKESTDLTPEPVPGRWECIRFADWTETLSVHANCAHVPLQVGKGRVRGDARRVRRKRSKRVAL
ncbi:Hypothetical protein CGLY_15570 [Corynebacterium glyciniphilum AJ 3170]|uniref:Uncharacterized protein n=2 Tax=Corynebacterium TaxID=1716 RepID=X5EDS0_9CORY|nr:Hypothetical protein CGLY_15570 [Corynebacterium glyciniphilum AJ 3170]